MPTAFTLGTSPRYPHFVRVAFAAVLETAGIRYVHRGETLGGYRTGGYAAPLETDPFRQGRCAGRRT